MVRTGMPRGAIGEVVVVSVSSKSGSNIERDSPYGSSAKTGLMVRLGAWGLCLAAAVVAALWLNLFPDAPDPAVRAAVSAAAAAGYLVAFAHCLMRFAYSRWSSWLLFTAGFAGLFCSGVVHTIGSIGLLPAELVREGFDLISAAMLPVAAALLLAAAHASRARTVSSRSGVWKSYVRAGLIASGFVVLWRYDVWHTLGEMLAATNVEPMLVVHITSLAALVALIHRTRRLSKERHDEVVVPMSYWAVGMVLATIVSLATWTRARAGLVARERTRTRRADGYATRSESRERAGTQKGIGADVRSASHAGGVLAVGGYVHHRRDHVRPCTRSVR
jgi:hypothetical protein